MKHSDAYRNTPFEDIYKRLESVESGKGTNLEITDLKGNAQKGSIRNFFEIVVNRIQQYNKTIRGLKRFLGYDENRRKALGYDSVSEGITDLRTRIERTERYAKAYRTLIGVIVRRTGDEEILAAYNDLRKCLEEGEEKDLNLSEEEQ